ncbi:ABC transporter ATP-binding protein [Treponema bryantii]|uniref:ABC transporter ATP-binding protein n=1 Tax=Treponema bryantii TaxID=163 RepID=UPI002B2FA81E|nr:sugar ABC transporter ATP-binding protein [Treponema bryantii]
MKVRIDNVTKKFGHTTAVSNFSAELEDGHLICLLGPSGCGKSTLLNMLCGIIPVTEGKIFFDDKDVTALPPDQRNIGMVFQNYALYPHMTVSENISFPLEVLKVNKEERKARVDAIAKLVHVDTLLRRYPSELSGGQQQRVAIARAMVKNPALLLMDEPLSNLDARLRLEMREEIRHIQKETGVTTVFVTHDQEEAMSISDSILLMKDGLLIQSGLCQELYKNPNCLFVAEFLGNPPANKLVEDQKITAIRPESFYLDDNGTEAEILAISEMGKDQIVTLSYRGNTVRAILNLEDESITTGSKIKVSLKEKGVFYFDNQGRRL